MKALKLGHVHLKVRDLDSSVSFYQTLLGLEITERVGRFVFLSDGTAHHTLALQALGEHASSPAHSSVGLYHTAFEVENISEFERVQKIAKSLDTKTVTVDHGISWAMYLSDPDGNGVEVYVDRRAAESGRSLWVKSEL